MLEAKPKMKIYKVFMALGFAFTLALILINVVAFFAVPFAQKFMPEFYNSGYFLFAISTIPLMVIGLPTVFAVTCFIPTVKSNYKLKLSPPKLLKIIVISYIVMILLNMISLFINMMIDSTTGIASSNPLDAATAGGILPTFVFAVILSPIIEEIMFRYVIINKLRIYGSGVSIFVSGFIFGLFHGNLFQMLYAIGIGIILAAVYYKTGKLIYSIIIHIAVNFLGSVVPMGIATQKNEIILPCVAILMAALFAGFILGIITLCKADYSKLKYDIMPKQYLKPFFLNAGIIVYILLIATIVAVYFVKG